MESSATFRCVARSDVGHAPFSHICSYQASSHHRIAEERAWSSSRLQTTTPSRSAPWKPGHLQSVHTFLHTASHVDRDTQNTEGTAYHSPGKDVEGSPKFADGGADPYEFRSAIKSDPELSDLRQRKHGKQLADYHKKQNEVRVYMLCYYYYD